MAKARAKKDEHGLVIPTKHKQEFNDRIDELFASRNRGFFGVKQMLVDEFGLTPEEAKEQFQYYSRLAEKLRNDKA